MRINSFAQQEIFLFATTREGGIDFPRWTIYIDGGPRSADGETLARWGAIARSLGQLSRPKHIPRMQEPESTPTTQLNFRVLLRRSPFSGSGARSPVMHILAISLILGMLLVFVWALSMLAHMNSLASLVNSYH